MGKREIASVSLYKLDLSDDLTYSLAEKYRPGAKVLKVGACEALLYTNEYKMDVSWGGDVAQLTGEKIELKNGYASAVLVIRDSSENVWAISWGQGYRRIDSSVIDSRFGMRFLTRALSPKKLRGVSHSTLDYRGRTDRTIIPGGATVRELGVFGYGELVRAANGSVYLEGLQACLRREKNGGKKRAVKTAAEKVNGREVSVRGGNALKIPLSMNPTGILSDLSLIGEVLKREPHEEYQLLDQLQPINKQEAIYKVLEQKLVDFLEQGNDSNVAVVNYFETDQFEGRIAAYRVRGIGDNEQRIFTDFFGFQDVIEWLNKCLKSDTISKLETIEIQPYKDSDARDSFSNAVALYRWLLVEITIEEKRYCLLGGKWYLLDQDYAKIIEKGFEEILTNGPVADLPPWPLSEDEGEYNERLKETYNGVVLDKKLARSALHKRGIEICDFYSYSGNLIHVKRARSSSDLSHLYAQVLVSSESLRRDEEARREWATLVRNASGQNEIEPLIKEVWIVHGTDKDLDSGELFTFSKVNLVRQVQLLKNLGVNVRIMRAPSSEKYDD